jgi:hypothetical protein
MCLEWLLLEAKLCVELTKIERLARPQASYLFAKIQWHRSRKHYDPVPDD